MYFENEFFTAETQRSLRRSGKILSCSKDLYLKLIKDDYFFSAISASLW